MAVAYTKRPQELAKKLKDKALKSIGKNQTPEIVPVPVDTRVIVLLDIDGVLNPMGIAADREEDFTKVDAGWVSWMLALEWHGKMVRQIHEQAKIVYVSSWEDDSNVASEFFELPEFEYVHFPRNKEDMTGKTWKIPTIEKYAEKHDNPIVWIDDEVVDDAFEWAKNRPNTLIIKTDPDIGYTEEDHKKVMEFISQHGKKKKK
jgi:hypothetical protein